MERKQTFGWTQMGQPAPDKYVKYVALFRGEGENGEALLVMRDDDCREVSLVLPRDARQELGHALLASD